MLIVCFADVIYHHYAETAWLEASILQWGSMAPRPHAMPGQYWMTRPAPTRVVCKGYSRPPSQGGRHLVTIERGTYVGPVEQVEITWQFTTILVRGMWINVWGQVGTEPGVFYAYLVSESEVQEWYRQGWVDL